MQRYYSLFLALIFCICSLGCTKQNTSAPPKEAGKQAKPVTHTITAPKAGRIIGLIAEKGERISKGQPLFAMADEELELQYKKVVTELAKAEAKYKVMQSGIPENSTVNPAALQAKVETAQQKADKMQQLLAIGGISRVQAEKAQQELLAARQALLAAQQQGQSAKPASPEALAEQEKVIAALKEQKNKLAAKQQEGEILCPATVLVKEVLQKNNANVSTNQVILILETTE